MSNIIHQFFYLGWWFFQVRFLGKKKPLQTVLFVGDKCNLACKHCSVYQKENPHKLSYENIHQQLLYSYKQGSRFVDFEGGEVMLWRDDKYTINDLIDLAKSIGFFTTTITTNAQLPFTDSHADSIWVSLDGIGSFHEFIRGKNTFERLENNIASSGHKRLNVNMVINKYNYTSVEDTIRYVNQNPYIRQISINFYTPFPDAEDMTISEHLKAEIIDLVIRLKKEGMPIMNSVSGLKFMKHNNFKRRCWVTNFIYPDGSRSNCVGEKLGICDRCGLCMAGEMTAVFRFKPDTLFAGLNLRL